MTCVAQGSVLQKYLCLAKYPSTIVLHFKIFSYFTGAFNNEELIRVLVKNTVAHGNREKGWDAEVGLYLGSML